MKFRCWRRREDAIATSMMMRKSPPPMVGVPALCWWSSLNISDFSPVAVLSRIVFPAFRFFRSLI